MTPELRRVANHMRELGLGSMRHALRLGLYDGGDNHWWGELSILHAAHAAEILVKARIAQEHPLLVFDQVPRRPTGSTDLLSFKDLVERGRTLQYQDLPERLWAVTGIRLPREDTYFAFGRLRNAIQHFASPTGDPRQHALEFVFSVIDPFIGEQWGLFAIDYNEEFGDHYEHIVDVLARRNLRPRVSPTAAQIWSRYGLMPGAKAPRGYASWFRREVKRALPDASGYTRQGST